MNIFKLFTLLVLVCFSAANNNCGPGGVICSTGACQFPSYIQGCYIYASATSCAQCQFNYVKHGNKCVYSPSNQNGCCKTYSSNGNCLVCAEGLSLINNVCQDRKIVGCIQKSNTGSCVVCALDYQLIGGICLKKIPGCSSYSSVGSCQSCLPNYSFTSGVCIPNISTQQTIPGCQVHFDYGCADCSQGYKLLPDGKCQNGQIYGCQRYNNLGVCISCKKPIYTLQNGNCVSYGCLKVLNNRCVQCDAQKGFIIDNTGFCQLSNCLVSNFDKCLICQPGYTQSSNRCVQGGPQKVCTVCPLTHFQSGSDCILKQQYCINYVGSRCTQCQPNYYLSSKNQCILKQSGCIYNNGICTSCQKPFIYKNGRCTIQGCTSYNFNGCTQCTSPYVLSNGFCNLPNCVNSFDGKCITCNSGFKPNSQGICYSVDPLCKSYDDLNGKCKQCNLGYYLNGNICQKQIFGCNYVDRKCVSCRAPFTYNSNKMTCQIEGCTSYFLGGCQTCASGYDLRYNYCKLPNCLISNNGICTQCDPDYVLRGDGVCVNKDQFCWKYDNKGFCSQCAPTYYMSTVDKKCKIRQPGCKYDANDKCYACQSPFYFDGVRCQIDGCLQLAKDGCKQCYYPMQLNKNKLCSVPNCQTMNKDTCITCVSGFVLAKDGSCQKADKTCQVYGNKGCIKCIKGYAPDQNGKCQYYDQHCNDFSQQGHCVNCDRLYFLNQFNKCQIKDTSCVAYSGGRCCDCKPFYYLHNGLCFPNTKGCINQKDIKTCLQCQNGYTLSNGRCTQSITKLSWDSIDMDFWQGSTNAQKQVSRDIFTVGKTNKYNLDGAIIRGGAKVIYSSVISNRYSFQVDDNSDKYGWAPSENTQGQWVGVLLSSKQIFYALDIKYLSGNTMTQFAIQQSDDGINFRRVTILKSQKMIIDYVQTFYFKAVQSKAIRIIVLGGIAHFKFQFYYSNGQNQYFVNTTSSTWIQQQTTATIIDSFYRGQTFSQTQSCADKSLCWMGIQICQLSQIKGFSLQPKQGTTGLINTVNVKYSLDGNNFICYNNCEQINVPSNGNFVFNPSISAVKLRIYPVKATGKPQCIVTFDY